MIELGKYNLLEVARSTPHGLYLEDKEGNDVLLPGKFIPEGTAVGDYLEVYIYRDNEERLVATTEEPKITLYEFASLKVSDVSEHGAFVDYGVGKDLFIPFREQKVAMEVDKYYLVYMYLDGQTDRLAGSTKIEQFLDLVDVEEDVVEVGDEVLVTVWGRSELGTNVIVNNRYKGLIYANELFENLKVGMTRAAYIHRVREDGKLDIRLEKDGYAKVEDNAQKILNLLKKRDGYLLLTDKSSPELIKKQLGMSKKTFKKSIGALYKQKRISLEDRGIRLLE
ncbi:S1-like domain-containing RNA-binding protein [Aureispira sp. CCB-E]|uniref:CvfB family protein n=1 Tax=Aureispira sp. CCB-E TaxID=3051121 RepID=UPI002868A432|nr:S1-like domain-containing RNA-binding protein [Aureispira sp. CCB-E]WMX12582.1 S1-like domain-containing RNA-binding protein [Aureispira sp. CCB-E]